MSLMEERTTATTDASATTQHGSCHEDVMYWSEQKRVSSLSTDSGHPQSVISVGETVSVADLLSMDVRERSLVFTNLSEDLQEAIVLSRRIRSGSDPSDKQETVIDNKVDGSVESAVGEVSISTVLHSLSERIEQFINDRRKRQ